MMSKTIFYLPEALFCVLALLGQWHILLAWCLLSIVLCALSYICLGPRVFQKNDSGEIPLFPRLVHLPWLWEYKIIVAIDRWQGSDGVNEISPGLWLGRRLQHSEIPEGIKLVVDLTAEFPKIAGLSDDVDYLCLPTLDGYAPEAEAFKVLLDKVNAHPGPILIHCARGHGRSATLMAALLISRELVQDLGEAYNLMKSKRDGIHLHKGQLKLLQSMY